MAVKDEMIKQLEDYGYMIVTLWAELRDCSKAYISTQVKELLAVGSIKKAEKKVKFRGKWVEPISLGSNPYDGSEHSLLVTECLIDIMKAYPESKFRREPDSPIHQPDAAVVVKEGTREALILLEVAKTELLTTLYSKINHYQSIDVSSFFVGLSYRTAPPWGILIVTDKKISIDRPGVRVVNKFRKELL